MMNTKTGCILQIVGGTFLLLGPLWGLLLTVVGMIWAFARHGGGGPVPTETLASEVALAFYATVIGIVLFPIGVALLIRGILMLLKLNREKAGTDLTANGR